GWFDNGVFGGRCFYSASLQCFAMVLEAISGCPFKCQSEYRALAHTTSELMWIQSLLLDLKIPIHTPALLCDNVSAVLIAHYPVLHACTKHLELDIHFVREKVVAKALHIQHVPGSDQIALTKPLPTSRFLALRDKLKVFDSDQVGSIDTCKAPLATVFHLVLECIHGAKKQEIVAQSMTKAEFLAAAELVNQALWIRKLLKDVQHKQRQSTKIYVDSQSCNLNFQQSSVSWKDTKHFNETVLSGGKFNKRMLSVLF
ncbi:putative copia-type protein, partial [Trifolium pratense]